MTLARLNPDGTLDTSFGEAGTVTSIGVHASASAPGLQPDGKLIAAGYASSGSRQEFLLARLNANGTLDASFDGGVVMTPIGANDSVADAPALQPDGKVVASGYTTSGTNDVSGDQFALARYQGNTLTVQKAGAGTVTSTPNAILCGATCDASFAAAAPVTLTAAPATGSTFDGWTGGGCSGTGPCHVLMASDQTVTATFSLIPETLTVTRSGEGSGTVTSSPAGINCGPSCSGSYAYGTTVTLKATPASGSRLKSWAGACSETSGCSVTMTQARSTTATFELKPACIVPRVKGASLKIARARITHAHCRTGTIARRYSNLKKGQVISETPRARRHLRNDAKINLAISKGKRP